MTAIRTSEQRYPRAMVEAAIMSCMTSDGETSEEAKEKAYRVFKNRIKNLLNIDREKKDEDLTVEMAFPWAFHDYEGQGHGNAVEFSERNAFMLLIGIEFLDAGYKQREVVRLLQLIRNELTSHFDRILADSRFNNPSFDPDEDSVDISARDPDSLYYMAIRRVELSALSAEDAKVRASAIEAIRPAFRIGVSEMQRLLMSEVKRYRLATILELSEPATSIVNCLRRLREEAGM